MLNLKNADVRTGIRDSYGNELRVGDIVTALDFGSSNEDAAKLIRSLSSADSALEYAKNEAKRYLVVMDDDMKVALYRDADRGYAPEQLIIVELIGHIDQIPATQLPEIAALHN